MSSNSTTSEVINIIPSHFTNIGDNFHEIVLENKTEILKQFKEIKAIQQLEKVEDSIKLGQLFIDYKLLIPFERDPR